MLYRLNLAYAVVLDTFPSVSSMTFLKLRIYYNSLRMFTWPETK